MSSEDKDNLECGGLPPLAADVCGASSADKSGGKPPQSKAIKPAQSINFGIQPLDKIMEERGLKNHDLVAASKDGLTHKQVQKGRKGRRLTRNVQDKIAAAISAYTGTTYKLDQLFNYL